MNEEERKGWWDHFQQLGRKEVERRLQPASSDKWSDPYNRYASQWLDELDQEAARRHEAVSAAQTEAQRRAADAAVSAAAHAREANDLARDANSIAATANSLAERANNQSRIANQTAKIAMLISAIAAFIAIIAVVLKK